MRRRRLRLARGLLGAALAAAAATALAQTAAAPRPTAPASAARAAPAPSYAERYAALCAACHGANGRSETELTPVLAGQPSFYAVTQLFLFRAGRRDNEAMAAVARTLSDGDLRGFSDFIGRLPPVPAPAAAAPPDAARLAQGQALAQRHLCASCHGADYSGGQQVPRLAQQREDYLARALRGFRAGTRVGYTPAMNEALSGLQPEELDTLAYYLARFPGPAAPK